MRRFANTIIVCITGLLFLLGCGESQPPVDESIAESSSGASESQPATTDEVGSISLESIGLVSNELHVEPSKEAWRVEMINDAAGRKLSELGHLMESQSLAESDLESIVSPEIQTSVPALSDNPMMDGVFRVRRSIGKGTTARGRSAFGDVLMKFAAPYGSDPTEEHAHVKFKVYKVSEDSGVAITKVAFSIGGRTRDGLLQQSATWDCVWSMGADLRFHDGPKIDQCDHLRLGIFTGARRIWAIIAL